MNVARSLQRLGIVPRARTFRPALRRSFASSAVSLSNSSPLRNWTPTPFVTETVVCLIQSNWLDKLTDWLD